MARVVFMCGPAGSGKTAIARELERHGYARLSIDEEAWQRGVRTMPPSEEIGDAIEKDIKRRLVELIRQAQDVVLDLSFSSRRVRDEYRLLLAPLGVTPETIYVQTPRDVALSRVAVRTSDSANGFGLLAHVASNYYDDFEVPTPDEGPLVVMPGVEDSA